MVSSGIAKQKNNILLTKAADPARQHLSQVIAAAINNEFHATLSSNNVWSFLEIPANCEHGDFSLPCFRLSKSLRLPPIVIANKLQKLVSEQLKPWVGKVIVIKAFLNFFLDQKMLLNNLLPTIIDHSNFAILSKTLPKSPDSTLVEYSQPNTHKEFHIGHGRNVCLGNAVCRLLSFCGNNVIAVNYIGDEGAHVAKCLWQMQEQTPNDDERKTQWYGKQYAKAVARLTAASDEDQQRYNQQISAILFELEAKSGPYYDKWLRTRHDCLKDFDRIYKWLNVHFDHVFYESKVSEASQKIVNEYIDKGLFVESDGAYGVSLEEKNLGYFMARKSDGTSLYITKDLALALEKFAKFKLNTSLYVVGNEQNYHFKQLFCVLEMMGFAQANQCKHISYAHVKLKSGKMSSRTGNAQSFYSLIDLVQERINEHLAKYLNTWPQAEIKQASHRLTDGAIKYGMLATDPQKEIIFDPEHWSSFEGNSGPYLMYSYARARSILNKSTATTDSISYDNLHLQLQHSTENALIRSLYAFNNNVVFAATNYRPSILCTYLYELAKTFNRFYTVQSVLKEQNVAQRQARLLLVEGFTISLQKGLSLLGITPPQRM